MRNRRVGGTVLPKVELVTWLAVRNWWSMGTVPGWVTMWLLLVVTGVWSTTIVRTDALVVRDVLAIIPVAHC